MHRTVTIERKAFNSMTMDEQIDALVAVSNSAENDDSVSVRIADLVRVERRMGDTPAGEAT